MKIIVFGSGALGSLMIHFLCKAGNDVTVVARSTADELRRNGLIVKHYLQRKTSIDHPTILESVPTGEHFDIAFSVMQGQQQKELLETFKKLDTNILVLVGNNLEAEFCQNSILEKRPVYIFFSDFKIPLDIVKVPNLLRHDFPSPNYLLADYTMRHPKQTLWLYKKPLIQRMSK